MKIHSICMVKNESDIITQTLKAAVEWSDYIYVYDNGSTDGTWEQVLELSQEHKQIIPYQQDNRPYDNNLRNEIFNYYRENSSEKDWWCRLDADEIYIDNPRIFLAKIPYKYMRVVNAIFDYYFTDKDLVKYNEDPTLYADDVPVQNKCRYYINNWSEIRFFRYRSDIVWKDNDGGWPSTIMQWQVYPVKIWMKHYQYRSPLQIQKRLDNRREAILNKKGFIHEADKNWGKHVIDTSYTIKQAAEWDSIDWEIKFKNISNSWQERIIESSKLNYDNHDNRYVVREDLMPNFYGVNDFDKDENKYLKTKLFNSNKLASFYKKILYRLNH
jgi:hypothetical protein